MDFDGKGDSMEELKGLQISALDDDEEIVVDEDDSEEVEDDDDEEEAVILGFVEKPEHSWSLLRQHFPSKAGGVPAWLDPDNLPSGMSCVCDICGEPLQFVLQVLLFMLFFLVIFQCSCSVDDGFPVVRFHFEDSLVLTVYPHDYLFQIREDVWCLGWQNSGTQSKDGKEMILLGDLVLSNKLVIYDIENQTIGWTEYNCSSSIKVMDEKSGMLYSVGAHDIGSASSLTIGGILTLLSVLVALLHSSIA
ncbi:hypothetical protein CRYUN_Cryun09bG0159400 [Craigia yunnanensis]